MRADAHPRVEYFQTRSYALPGYKRKAKPQASRPQSLSVKHATQRRFNPQSHSESPEPRAQSPEPRAYFLFAGKYFFSTDATTT